MADSNHRPSILSKHTDTRHQKHQGTFPTSLLTAPRTLDRLIVGLGYAGLAGYLYSRIDQFSTRKLATILLGSLTLGYGLFDLGKREGMIQGVSFAPRNGKDKDGKDKDGEKEDWRGEFKNREYEELSTAEKIAWLRQEESRIRELQEEEQLRCGQAYIAKEEAYVAYERHGGYGGRDWKQYSKADNECREMYNEYEGQQKRLSQIGVEINGLSQQI